MSLFTVAPFDKEFYEEKLRDFLPANIIDIHTHVWLDRFRFHGGTYPLRTASWPSMVANDNSIEDLVETYRLMFPGKSVVPLIFSSVGPEDDIESSNEYIRSCAKRYGFPSLIYATPKWGPEELENQVLAGGFLGCKVFLSHAAPYLPENEIRIFDFLPHHQLEVLDRHGWIAMLHIPRSGRLKDPVNLAQMLEIEARYPRVKLIIAHVGRAYCPQDVGNAFEILSQTRNMKFDFSANCNGWVFEQLIRHIGPKRILFGSDMPILRMRTKRICEDGNYVNLIPEGLYGPVHGDRHIRGISREEAKGLTFFMYEEIDAFRCAANATGLTKADVEDVFYNNAKAILAGSGTAPAKDGEV